MSQGNRLYWPTSPLGQLPRAIWHRILAIVVNESEYGEWLVTNRTTLGRSMLRVFPTWSITENDSMPAARFSTLASIHEGYLHLMAFKIALKSDVRFIRWDEVTNVQFPRFEPVRQVRRRAHEVVFDSPTYEREMSHAMGVCCGDARCLACTHQFPYPGEAWDCDWFTYEIDSYLYQTDLLFDQVERCLRIRNGGRLLPPHDISPTR